VQFAQTSEGTEPRSWTPPATVAHPPAPVTVLGLRMRVSDAERARVQWEEILHARCVARTDARVVYRWPESPMALTIDIDPSGAEGPVAIELAATRPLDVPPGPVPELGATFRLPQP
jgi:hypothetical protein